MVLDIAFLQYTLVKFTDMHVEMKEEAMDICITAVEKYPNDAEKCTQVGGGWDRAAGEYSVPGRLRGDEGGGAKATHSRSSPAKIGSARSNRPCMACSLPMQMIKDQMDKKFGAPWHVVVGKGFSYEITYEVRAGKNAPPSKQSRLCKWSQALAI